MRDFLTRIKRLSPLKQELLARRVEESGLEARNNAGRSVFKPTTDGNSQGERLVAYVVSQSKDESIIDELRNHLKKQLPEYMVPSIFIMLDSLPRKPNGKIDRLSLPQPDKTFSEGEEPCMQPRTHFEKVLAKIWAEVLSLEMVSVNDNFFEVGGDSLLSIRIISRANQEGFRITPQQFFQYPTISELASVAENAPDANEQEGIAVGPVPLTPIQHWFFARENPSLHHWNQSVLFEVPKTLTFELVEHAIQLLVQHHDALRLRYERGPSGWQQFNADVSDSMPVSRVDISSTSHNDVSTVINEKSTHFHVDFDFQNGMLIKVVLFELGGTLPNRLLFIVHHLAIDGLSWRILLDDFALIYKQLTNNKPVTLPRKTTSFKTWAENLASYADGESVHNEFSFWSNDCYSNPRPLPVDYSASAYENTEATTCMESASLDAEATTALLYHVSPVYHTQINDILLAALVLTLERWTGNPSLLVGMEGHGRESIFEGVDLSRTVGWFTSYFPVYLEVSNTIDLGQVLIEVKEQLRKIPNRGIGYGLLRYCCQDSSIREQMRTHVEPQICFNYLGNVGENPLDPSVFRKASESTGVARCPECIRSYLLEFNAYIENRSFRIRCAFSKNIHRNDTIAQLVRDYIDRLRSLISHCQSPDAGGFSPSDFPLADLDSEDLNQLSDLLSPSD